MPAEPEGPEGPEGPAGPAGPAESAVVRRVRHADWPQLRALRLEALADSPLSFMETLEQASAMDDAGWQARAARGAEGGDSFQVLALQAGRAVGTTVCFLRDDAAWLAAVYVAPPSRGRGVLDRLAARCCAWATGQGAGVLRLHVHERNDRARAAYRRLGFADTGVRTPHPNAPAEWELMLERALPG